MASSLVEKLSISSAVTGRRRCLAEPHGLRTTDPAEIGSPIDVSDIPCERTFPQAGELLFRGAARIYRPYTAAVYLVHELTRLRPATMQQIMGESISPGCVSGPAVSEIPAAAPQRFETLRVFALVT